jgi:RimJ/RimL family protein N-acetyltransferase
MTIPVLDTERLILRGHTRDDFPAYADMWMDPEVTRYITTGGVPRPRDEAWKSFLAVSGQWALLNFGTWLIQDRRTGQFLGEVGWIERNREPRTAYAGMPELGYALVNGAAGQGLATEAVKAAIIWGRAHFGSISVLAVVSPANLASIRVVEKSGFAEIARNHSAGRDSIYFAAQL